MNPNDLRMPDANKRASDMLNRWLRSVKEQGGLFISKELLKIAITRLGFAVVAELESAYSDGWNAAVAAQQAEREKEGY